MDTNTHAAGSSPAPAPATSTPPANPAPAAVSPATPVTATPTTRDVASVLTSAERRLLATGQKTFKEIIAARPQSAPATPPAAPAAPATPATPAQPAEVQPATPAETNAEPQPETPAQPAVEPAAQPAAPATPDEMPDRFRFKDPADQAIALIAKSRNMSLLEASRVFAAENLAAATPATPAAPATPAVDPALQAYDQQLADLNAKITKLSEDRKKAREDVEMEKADSLSDEIAAATTERLLLQNERQGYIRNREQTATQTVQQQVTASKERAVNEYAELATEGTLHREALDAFVQRAINDPQRAALFRDPTWPEKLTAEFAAKHGLKKKGAASAAPVPAAAPAKTPTPTPTPTPTLRPKVQQVPGAKLNSGADGSQPSAPGQPTVDDVKAALPRMTPAQRRQVLFGR